MSGREYKEIYPDVLNHIKKEGLPDEDILSIIERCMKDGVISEYEHEALNTDICDWFCDNNSYHVMRRSVASEWIIKRLAELEAEYKATVIPFGKRISVTHPRYPGYHDNYFVIGEVEDTGQGTVQMIRVERISPGLRPDNSEHVFTVEKQWFDEGLTGRKIKIVEADLFS